MVNAQAACEEACAIFTADFFRAIAWVADLWTQLICRCSPSSLRVQDYAKLTLHLETGNVLQKKRSITGRIPSPMATFSGFVTRCLACLLLSDRAHHGYQVTVDAFEGILGAENCEPRDIYIAATVDQGRNLINAFDNMGVPVLICSGHRLNSAVSWSTGIGGTYAKDGAGTCKNRACRDLVTKVTAMVGHMTHSVCNNDAFKKVQAEVTELTSLLELVRRNDTRYERRGGHAHGGGPSFLAREQ